jgi:NTP pyrophosphatase (non-canonical NTP hydrolase)
MTVSDKETPETVAIKDLDEWRFEFDMANIQRYVHNAATQKGFNDLTMSPLFVPTKLALIVTEIAEAIEAHRCGNLPDQHLPGYNGVSVELADAVIRILDLAESLKIPLGQVIIDKLRFNAGRPYKHNKLY